MPEGIIGGLIGFFLGIAVCKWQLFQDWKGGTPMLSAEQLKDCRKAAVAIYTAVPEDVANDIADKINALLADRAELEQALQQAQADAAALWMAAFAVRSTRLYESEEAHQQAIQAVINLIESTPTPGKAILRVVEASGSDMPLQLRLVTQFPISGSLKARFINLADALAALPGGTGEGDADAPTKQR